MKTPPPPPSQPHVEYIIFDRKTGRILQRHSRLDALKNESVQIPIDELRTRFSRDDSILARTTDRDPSNVDFLEIKSESGDSPATGAFVVDPKKRQLVAKPALSLKTDKQELTGNGDKAVIDIQVLDESGKPVRTHDGKVKITTSRGKLSAPGGVVQLERGHAKIDLISVNETVSRVTVDARTLDDSCSPARLTLEFL
ncbi:MAG: hypothetical protein QM760_10840 [Nibricoccus sp.]